MASNSSRRSAAQTPLTEGLQAIPTSPTALSTADSWIWQLVIANGGNQRTVTILDGQGTAINLTHARVFAANTTTIYSWPEAVKMIGGITWSASGTGCNAEIFATKAT